MDIVLSALALVAFAPLLLVIATAVKATSPGPVLFRQLRPGKGGVPFALYKFRTMRLGDGPCGSRITPFGGFLRQTSLDELPQLVSVLLGQMSLVGPRPHPEGMLAGGMDYRDLVPHYAMRYAMKPGLSGWAQANGLRGPVNDATAARARIAHDLAYIQNFSVWLDVKIIWRTLWCQFLTGSGS